MSRVLRTIGLLFGFVALAALPAVGLGAFAAADSGPPPSTADAPGGAAPQSRSPLTDEQRQCLADHGVTLPVRPASGAPRQAPSQADRDALRAAAEACGLTRRGFHRGPGIHPRLTDEQRQCLADHGVTLPLRPASGASRQAPSQADRDALRAAAEVCGIPLRAPHGEPRTV